MKKLLLAVVFALISSPALAGYCLPFMFSSTVDIRFCEVADANSDLCRVIRYADLADAVGNNKNKQAELIRQEAQDWIDVRLDLTGPELDNQDDGRDPYKDADPGTGDALDREFWSDVDGNPKSIGATHVTTRGCVISDVTWHPDTGVFTATATRTN